MAKLVGKWEGRGVLEGEVLGSREVRGRVEAGWMALRGQMGWSVRCRVEQGQL